MTRQLNAMHTGPRREDWETPADLYAKYDAEFGFTLDAAANADNAKCPVYFSGGSLERRWPGIVWLNPPYGKAIGAWVQKAYWESQRGSTVVCLVPARTDSWWWHDYTPSAEVRFIRGRIKFVGAPYNAPFPSAILIFRPPTSLRCAA
jgi:phage N-6-adenine-methyltransferase